MCTRNRSHNFNRFRDMGITEIVTPAKSGMTSKPLKCCVSICKNVPKLSFTILLVHTKNKSIIRAINCYAMLGLMDVLLLFRGRLRCGTSRRPRAIRWKRSCSGIYLFCSARIWSCVIMFARVFSLPCPAQWHIHTSRGMRWSAAFTRGMTTGYAAAHRGIEIKWNYF